MKRSELRENIFKIIFGVEFNPLEELNEKITLYIDQMDEVSEKDAIYITEKVQKVAEKLSVEKVGIQELVAAGVCNGNQKVKVLGNGTLTTKVEVVAHAFSKSAETAIQNVGGTATKL